MIQKGNLLTLEDTNFLKGFFTITVLIHHIFQNTTFLKNSVNFLFEDLGYLSVSVFFFLSGYGLTLAYKTKGINYINNFPKKKILPLYIYNLILIAFYLALWLVVNQPLKTKRVVLSFFFGHTVIKYGWYIQSTLFLYLLFYIVFKLQNKFLKITALIIGYAIYFTHCHFLDCWSMWYISVLAFAVGIIHAIKPRKINTAIYVVAFFILYILSNISIFNNSITDLFKMIIAMIFPIIIFNLQAHTKLRPRFFDKISTYSFEIYTSQGLFFTLFHSNILYINNQSLYILTVIVSAVVFALLLHKIFISVKFKA